MRTPMRTMCWGLCYLNANRFDDARVAFANQFGVSPASGSAYLLLAKMLMQANLQEAASGAAKKALELTPTLALAHFLLGEFYLVQIGYGAGAEGVRAGAGSIRRTLQCMTGWETCTRARENIRRRRKRSRRRFHWTLRARGHLSRWGRCCCGGMIRKPRSSICSMRRRWTRVTT